MTLEDTAKKIAERIKTFDYAEIYTHHDADGIAAAAVISVALKRAGIPFKLKVLPYLNEVSVIENPQISILCDIGGSLDGFPETTVIIDHHIPVSKSQYHINPHLAGMSGDYELSAAGCAYIVANALGDNRDLAGLVMLGIIGDKQKLVSKNREIIGDAIGNNLINPKKGILLAGRSLKEQTEFSAAPYLCGISGVKDAAEEISKRCADKMDDNVLMRTFLSEIIARSDSSYYELMNLYGDKWILDREVVHDAHVLTYLVDACGKSGRYDIAFALAAGDSAKTEEAWEIFISFRKRIIEAVRSAERLADNVYLVKFEDAVSDAADIFSESSVKSVFVISRAENYLKVSARAPINCECRCDLEKFLKSAAAAFGGYAGGHKTRAGAEIPLSCEAEFVKMAEDAL
ncbi:MAG TPA: DHHA1 domain-containing protein [Methanocorpusculum sp.]|nr:DHHA1 domain-containing protein [Methanocorpusculum sp.]